MTFNRTEFGKRLRRVRKDAGLTQEQVGDKVGITNVAVSQFENAKSTPAPGTFLALAEALGVSVGVLLGDRFALAEYTLAPMRPQMRALGYDLALIPREDTP